MPKRFDDKPNETPEPDIAAVTDERKSTFSPFSKDGVSDLRKRILGKRAYTNEPASFTKDEQASIADLMDILTNGAKTGSESLKELVEAYDGMIAAPGNDTAAAKQQAYLKFAEVLDRMLSGSEGRVALIAAVANVTYFSQIIKTLGMGKK